MKFTFPPFLSICHSSVFIIIILYLLQKWSLLSPCHENSFLNFIFVIHSMRGIGERMCLSAITDRKLQEETVIP